MISAGDFRNGVTFEMDGQVVSIIEFQHVTHCVYREKGYGVQL